MKQKIALVLSGGGARGIAHIGVIEELEKQGYEISSIAGTSMGALVGGIYALGQLETLKEWLFTLDKMKVFSLVDFTFSSQGLIKGDKVLNTLKEIIEDRDIEELSIPYVAVATDLLHKKEAVFTGGSIYQAIRASIAIPTVFTPVKMNDSLLVDGGVVNNVPVNQVKRCFGDQLVVVDVNADVPVFEGVFSKKEAVAKQTVYQEKMKQFHNHLQRILPHHKTDRMGFFNLIDKTFSLMVHQITQLTLHQYAIDRLINISRDTCTAFDFYRAEELVEIGRYATRQSLRKMGK